MKLSKTRTGLIASTVAVAAFALIFTLAVPQTADAYGRGPGGFKGRGAPAKGVVNDTYLLEELGVSAEEYAAAQVAVNEAALQAAVDAGLITQERADAIKELSGDRGFGQFGMMGKFGRGGFSDFDAKAALAAELGITVEELYTAHEAAHEARLAQALEDGKITQEQYDRKQEMQALKAYLEEQGLQEDVRSAYEAAIAAAVADGVITQERADQLLSNQRGFGMRGGMRGFGGDSHGKRGGFQGRGFAPGTSPDNTTTPSSLSF